MLRIYICLVILQTAFCEEILFNINNKNVLHKVSEKFLSISIDPAVLLAGVNLSDDSLLLAKHLSPAYIRLAGASTPFVKYIDNEDDSILRKSREGITNVIITPSMWFGINEWLNLANLTPVFGINDNETDKGVWDPKSTLPLLEMSDKFGVTCYWQLGYDCSNKSTVQYVEDLNILRQTLNGFPEHNGTWKIVGSDLSRCIYDESIHHNFDNYITDLDQNVDAIMWESSLVPKIELGFVKSALWTSVPKDPKPVTFSSAMEWAKHVGEAAKMEYDVIFRQPRLLEMTHDSPVYWFSFLHKKLMGINVLDIRPTNPNSDLSTYAHCTKRQNNFVRTGAITIMIINNGSDTNTANIRPGNIMLEKSMEVQSYLLTASDKSNTKVFLNDENLTMDVLKRTGDILSPKLRRAKNRGYISLEVPPRSIGFFVLTGAKNTLCSNNEEDLDSILAEINEDQDFSLSEEEFKIEGRWQDVKQGDKSNTVGGKITLENIKKNILKEMELDKRFYGKMLKKQELNGDSYASKHFRDKTEFDPKKETLHKHLRAFIEKAKKSDVSKSSGANNQKENPTPSTSLRFTIKEIEDILKKRAQTKAAARNIKLTSSELDMLVDKATIRLPKHFVSKRDINALLLEEKANFHKNNMFSQEAYERYAKEQKLFPKLRYQRSVPSYKRKSRNINKKLLDLKANLEEHKKYMLGRTNHLRSTHSHKHKSLLSRSKRDINLDLLRKRTGQTSSHGKKIAMQPNIRSYKKHLHDDQEDKYASKWIPETDSDELFPDFLESEEHIIKDSKVLRKLFSEIADREMDISEFEGYSKKSKSKYNPDFTNLFYNPTIDIALTRKSALKKKENPAKFNYNELLESSNQFNNVDEEFQPCIHDWEFSLERPKEVKSNTFTGLLHLKSPKTGNYKKGKFAVIDLDDIISSDESDDLEYGYLRKKRETNLIAKEKLKILTSDIKREAKKLRKEITEDKIKYIREKIKNKMELGRKNQIEKLKEKGLITTTNIQIVPKNKERNENYHKDTKNISHSILSANSKEKSVTKLLNNKVKRSLLNNNLNSLFGQYQPLTPTLKPWKPINILGFPSNYLSTLPLMYWLQNQSMRNALLQNGYFAFRKRRYIEEGSVNSVENEILSDKDQKEDNKERGKTEFVKYPKQNMSKVKKLFIKTNYSELPHNLDINETTTLAINKNPAQKNFELVVDKSVSQAKMSYFEKILGNKIKPLENFIENVKESVSSMNHSVKHFFQNLFKNW